MVSDLQILPWDTRFFGYTVGRIDMLSYDEIELETLVEKAWQQGVKLLYVFTDNATELSPNIVDTYTGYLVDTKITYRYEVGQDESVAAFGPIEIFSAGQDVAQLYELAYQSGDYSRFKVDAIVGEENFKRLYRQWIDNSVSGQAADDTFVYVVDKAIQGFITVQKKPTVATIGLLATDKSVRGRGVGSALLNYVKHDLRASSAIHLDVATQKKNIVACRFYERNGFTVKSEVNVSHIWL
ncbi:GNAT family N-acetyltransferase [Spirosoma sp. BT704]|uniref:GNAT family N-acetyltransferase n=2 Tax=Spirosoma validum TaxID=2771355 RepID=A0A927GCE8_9BACT|nr:GNAT family N-acetyltransferase [Spirosoma validum]